MTNIREIIMKLEKQRKKLHDSLEAFGIESPECMKESKKMDELVLEYTEAVHFLV